MALLQEWRDKAYSQETDKKKLEGFRQTYFDQEKKIYEQILSDPENTVSGTVKELAEKFEVPVEIMTGFLDGINDSLKEPNPIEEMTEDTVVSLGFEPEKLFKNMVDAKADWLYGLPVWDQYYSKEEQKELYLEAKKMNADLMKFQKIHEN